MRFSPPSVHLTFHQVLGLVPLWPDQTTRLLVHTNIRRGDLTETALRTSNHASGSRLDKWKKRPHVHVWSDGFGQDLFNDRQPTRVGHAAALARLSFSVDSRQRCAQKCLQTGQTELVRDSVGLRRPSLQSRHQSHKTKQTTTSVPKRTAIEQQISMSNKQRQLFCRLHFVYRNLQ